MSGRSFIGGAFTPRPRLDKPKLRPRKQDRYATRYWDEERWRLIGTTRSLWMLRLMWPEHRLTPPSIHTPKAFGQQRQKPLPEGIEFRLELRAAKIREPWAWR